MGEALGDAGLVAMPKWWELLWLLVHTACTGFVSLSRTYISMPCRSIAVEGRESDHQNPMSFKK